MLNTSSALNNEMHTPQEGTSLLELLYITQIMNIPWIRGII